MKIILFSLFLLFSAAVSAQDTIFVRSGEIIPAVIVGKSSTEVRYKKSGQRSAAIYSLFTSDIQSIHYKDGIIADYTVDGSQINKEPENAISMAGTMKTLRVSIGSGTEFFRRNANDPFSDFWRTYTWNPSAQISGKVFTIPIIIRGAFTLGQSGRNYFGDELDLYLSTKSYITEDIKDDVNGDNSIRLSNSVVNIFCFFGHTINHKRNLAVVIEGGYTGTNMKGIVNIHNTDYRILGEFYNGPRLAIGSDWFISKRFTASWRVGYRVFKNEKIQFFNSSSWWGYFPAVNMNGIYTTFELSWNFYLKLPTFKPRN